MTATPSAFALGNKRRMARQAPKPSSPRINDPLLRYLAKSFDVPGLRFRSAPVSVGDGWENYIYHFQLEPTASLPAEFRRPLTLRQFAPCRSVQAQYEVAVQLRLHRWEYPVPAPLWWEQSSDPLGGPFLIMQQVAGPSMLKALFRRPWRVIGLCRQMAEVQARLHELPTGRFPRRPGRLLDRSYVEMESAIRDNHWHGLARGFDWLVAHQVASPRCPRILHLDFHPLNLIQRRGQLPAVLDWGTADLGDPHADIATTLMIMRCAPVEGKNRWQRCFAPVAREILRQVYLVMCRRRMDLCESKLLYYQAWAVLRRLVSSFCWLGVDPVTLGVKPTFGNHLQPDHLQDLAAEFERLTGVGLQLPEIAKATGWQ